MLCCHERNVVLKLQLRREVRLRREYLYRKAQESRLRTIEEKKNKVKKALEGRVLHFRFPVFIFIADSLQYYLKMCVS